MARRRTPRAKSRASWLVRDAMLRAGYSFEILDAAGEFGSHVLYRFAADVGGSEGKSELQDSTQRGCGDDQRGERPRGDRPQVLRRRCACARSTPQRIDVQGGYSGPDRIMLG